MDKLEDLITDKKIEIAWGNADFGEYLNANKRELINNTILKCVCGYYTGHTAECIVKELGLVTDKWELTNKGRAYLFTAFSKGKSY
jgi:hypothetical protein